MNEPVNQWKASHPEFMARVRLGDPSLTRALEGERRIPYATLHCTYPLHMRYKPSEHQTVNVHGALNFATDYRNVLGVQLTLEYGGRSCAADLMPLNDKAAVMRLTTLLRNVLGASGSHWKAHWRKEIDPNGR